MINVELIYDANCPNVADARTQLLRAFAKAQLQPHFVQWDIANLESPTYVRGYGSPTVLVNGKDVAGVAPVDDLNCCRLYQGATGELKGVPDVDLIVDALRAASASEISVKPLRKSGWWGSLSVLPGIGATLLPVGLCPACWPAYAGILSSLGIGFLLKSVYLLPLISVFLLIAVSVLAFRAGARRGYGPFIVGLTASAIILVGKFVFVSDASMYGGIVLLVVASVWNAWPQRATGVNSGACPACAPKGQSSYPNPRGAKEVSS